MAQTQLTREQRIPSGSPTNAEIETAVVRTAKLVMAASHAPMMPIRNRAAKVRIAVVRFTTCQANAVARSSSTVCGAPRNPSSTRSSSHLIGAFIA